MPFDPKLVHPDEPPLVPDGEIDLPADLAALGEQLRDDAARLAGCYPAAGREIGPRSLQAGGASRARKWMKIAILATTAAATFLIATIVIERFGGRERQPATVAEHPPSGKPSSTVDPLVNSAQAADVLPSAGTTVSLTELSGPELEALLDLWQREPKRSESTGISF